MNSKRSVRVVAALCFLGLVVLCSMQWLPTELIGQQAAVTQQQESEGQGKLPILPVDKLPATNLNAKIPEGLAKQSPVPSDNPLTEEKVALGRKLFFDPILSEDATVSCASCHQPDHGFASPAPKAIGLRGRMGKRNAPSLLNKAYAPHLFWDGRVKSLEEQAIVPLSNPEEMGSDVQDAIDRLRASEEYVALFESAFEDSGSEDGKGETAENVIRPETIGQAIASFERTLLIGNSKVDQFRGADYKSLSESARQGMWIFDSRGKCWKCHSTKTFSDQEFHNTGVGFGQEDRDEGRMEFTEKPEDRFKFKTPGLRGVEQTAPYMHDGSIATLREVVEFYNRGGSPNDPDLSDEIEPLNLSEEDIDNMVEFLKALSN